MCTHKKNMCVYIIVRICATIFIFQDSHVYTYMYIVHLPKYINKSSFSSMACASLCKKTPLSDCVSLGQSVSSNAILAALMAALIKSYRTELP